MRRIAPLAAVVAALATAATAWAAVTNTVSYTVTLKKSGSAKPTPKKPVNLTYHAKLHVDTDPPGAQPDTSPSTEIFFAKQIKQNAALLPSCAQNDIDGKSSVPAQCNRAIVGAGTADALAGSPGQPASDAIPVHLTVKLYNGGAKQILLVLNAAQPVAIQNAVVPGVLRPGKDGFGYVVDFQVPSYLQTNTGLAVALTDFDVTIPSKAFKVKIKGKTAKLSYLQLTGCPGGKIPTKAVGHFIDDQGQPASDVSSDSTAKC